MFEPRALRQRAELVDKTDLSSKSLTEGLGKAQEEERLKALFKTCDSDKSKGLNEVEFQRCLDSLELELGPDETIALFACAEKNDNNELAFPDFVTFFNKNLIHLEREKHVRILQSTLHKHHPHEGFDKQVVASHLFHLIHSFF